MEAQTSSKLSCSQLNPHLSLQQPTSSSATLRGNTLSVRQRLEWIETSVDPDMVTIFLEMEDKGLSIRETKEKVLPKSTGGSNIFNDDIFRFQKVKVGNCHRWSRNLVAEHRRPATVSAAPISSDGKTNPTGLFNRTIQFHKLDLGGPETYNKKDEKTEKRLKVVMTAQEEMCKQLPKKEEPKQAAHLEGLEDLHIKWQKKPQTANLDDFEDLTVLTDEMIEAAVKKEKDKSVRRRFLNWLDGLIHDHYRKKIAETYRREQEEGDQFYPTNFSFIYPMTRAQRERQKRELWLCREHQRQTIKRHLDAYWEKKREKKEALRVKEEERFQRWAAEHKVSIPSSPPDKPKSRMTIWEKRCLRAKEFFFH